MLGYVIYSDRSRLRTVSPGPGRDRETLSGSASLKNKVFQIGYLSGWKVEFTVTDALMFRAAPTEELA